VLDTLLNAFTGPGAGFMYAITALLALAVAVTIERCFTLWLRWRIDEEQALTLARDGQLDALVSATEEHPVGMLVSAGATGAAGEAAWDRMGAAAALLERAVRHRIPTLSAVGNLATMLGLLGTVYGLILAFSGLETASAVERSTRLGAGIATAMATTAWGLLVGIPALAAHAVLEGRARRLLAFSEALAGSIAATRRG